MAEHKDEFDTMRALLQAKTFLESLDDGPSSTLFEAVLARSKAASPEELVSVCLEPPTPETRVQARKLVSLIDEYQKLPQDRKQRWVTHSVVDWIHYSNKIEGAGFDSKSDTEKAVTGQHKQDAQQTKDVMTTLMLLRETYKQTLFGSKDPVADVTFDVRNLHKWHHLLTEHFLLSTSGVFRQWGVDTKARDGSRHVYPHHSVVPMAVESLGKFCYQLFRKGWSQNADKDNQILFVFSFAAFAQFHFVDLHPYVDGNGRLCRFLSKRILDCVCPIPFPQFKHRDRYIAALEMGRTVDFPSAPLASLLIDCAIQHYEFVLMASQVASFSELLVATYSNHAEFEASIKNSKFLKGCTPEEVAALQAAFTNLPEGKTVDIVIKGKVIRIKSWPDFSFDDI